MKSAPERFRRWVAFVGGTAIAARLLDCTRAHVSLLQTGQRMPSLRTAVTIERVTTAWPDGPILASSWIRAEAA